MRHFGKKKIVKLLTWLHIAYDKKARGSSLQAI